MDFHFLKNGNHFQYGFSIKDKKFIEEHLYLFTDNDGNNIPTIIFERGQEIEDIVFGEQISPDDFTLSKQVFKKSNLFLSCGAMYSQNKIFKDAYSFFSKDLLVYYNTTYKSNNWLQQSLLLIKESETFKKIFIKILKISNKNIQDIIITSETKENQDKDKNDSEVLKKKEKLDAQIKYSNNTAIQLIDEESTGIKKLFELFFSLYSILKTNAILFIDEIDNSLHEVIIYQILYLFKKIPRKCHAQLIFTTHNTNLLSRDLFRKDQIWFTEMSDDNATDLYSLDEIKNVQKDENLELSYLEGRYGGIPSLNDHFLHELSTSIQQTLDDEEKAKNAERGNN